MSFMPNPESTPQIPNIYEENSKINVPMSIPPPPPKWRKKPASEVGAKIDRIASITFPMAFAIFNFCYWSFYLL